MVYGFYRFSIISMLITILLFYVVLNQAFCFLSYGIVIDGFSFIILVFLFWLTFFLIILGLKYKFSFYKYINFLVMLRGFVFVRLVVKSFLLFYMFFEISLIPLLGIIFG